MLASACRDSTSPPPAPEPSGDVVSFGYPYEPPTLDPVAAGGASPATRDILRPVLPALFRLDADLRPQPELAAAWPGPDAITADPFSVRLRLREASWSDGQPITAEDVRFSHAKLSEGPTGYRYRPLRAVEAVGDRTVVLRFDRPVRRWWALFSVDDMVLPAHAYSPEWAQRPTVSGGPYAVGEWTEGLRVRLVRNDAYWGPRAIFAGIDVVFVPSEEVRFRLLESGELDAFFSEGDINLGRRARARDYLRTAGPLDGSGQASGVWGPTWWELDLDDELDDPLARAVTEAADPDLAGEILEDTGAAMDGIPARFHVPAGPIGGTWDGRGDAEETKRLAPPDGATVEVGFARESSAGSLATYLHFRLRPAGVTIELVGLESDAFERGMDDGTTPPVVLRIRRGADAPDAASYASASGEPGSAPVDDHVDAALSTVEAGAPGVGLDAAAWARAQDGLEGAGTVVPLARIRSWIVGREGLVGPHPTGALPGPLWNAAEWRPT